MIVLESNLCCQGNWVQVTQHCGEVHRQPSMKKTKCSAPRACIITSLTKTTKKSKIAYSRPHHTKLAPCTRKSSNMRYEKKFLLKNISGQIEDIKKKGDDQQLCGDDSKFEYMDPFGYRIIVCAYLNGYGAGKGTHLSFVVVVMKGAEEDDSQEHPILRKIKLTMVDQKNKKRHIMGNYKPDLSTTQGFHEAMTSGRQYAVEFPPVCSAISTHQYIIYIG